MVKKNLWWLTSAVFIALFISEVLTLFNAPGAQDLAIGVVICAFISFIISMVVCLRDDWE